MEQKRVVLSIIVDNQANVLTRIISLFGRRGFNIDSLTVSATNDESVSRITVSFKGNDHALNQIIHQTEKLEVVKDIFVLEREDSVCRELLLIKVAVDKDSRAALREVVEIFRGKIIDLSKESMVIELTGTPEKVDGFMNMLSCYEIVEMCRTGVTGINRGSKTYEHAHF